MAAAGGGGGLSRRTASFGSITDAFPLLRSALRGREDEADDHDEQRETLWSLMATYLSSDKKAIQRSIANHAEFSLARTRFTMDKPSAYRAAAMSVRDRLIEAWNDTNTFFDELDVKRGYYMSLEFLMGRAFSNALLNMDLEPNFRAALLDMGFKLEDLYAVEQDAALGNGGLGRLAACFLDSAVSLDMPMWGYGLRYTYGIFRQRLIDGEQREVPDYWLSFGNPWEIERKDVLYPVRFYGRVVDEEVGGQKRRRWTGGDVVVAMAYDNPVPAWDSYNCGNLRLWKAAPAREFDLDSFNAGDYVSAVEARQRAETITHVLYPNDNTDAGKELRLKQQYFFVSATLQDIMRRFKKLPRPLDQLPEKVCIQLNDTHPTLMVPELMRVLMDIEGLAWERAWSITQRCVSYTVHTLLSEALEKWSVPLMERLLPRHLEIIYEVNFRFLEQVRARFGDDGARLQRMSLIEESSPKMVRMANLAACCCHKVNGVAQLHTDLVRSDLFPDFHEMFPDRIVNVTNGVTPRRWVNHCNRGLANFITKRLGSDTWIKQLDQVADLRKYSTDPASQTEFAAIKLKNKERLAAYIARTTGVEVNPRALFDIQVKRIHEYKRQLMNALYCIHRYQWIKSLSPSERARVTPRVTIFAGKAASGYYTAKRVIKLISRVSEVVNNDPEVGDVFKVLFLENYNVSLAELLIPASDLSQHISTAGTEASGTSNMKFAMNGGLIIGTLDGANVEINTHIGEGNMFIFGATTPEVPGVREQQRTRPPVDPVPELAAVLRALQDGAFGPREEVGHILEKLEWRNDHYLIRHDFADYMRAQREVDRVYNDKAEWTRRGMLSTAGMGFFSSDRSIEDYATTIWGLEPARRPEPEEVAEGKVRARSFPDAAPSPSALGRAAEDLGFSAVGEPVTLAGGRDLDFGAVEVASPTPVRPAAAAQ